MAFSLSNKIEKPSGLGMENGLWQSKRHVSLTAKKMRGVGGEEAFPSSSFHVRRADTNTIRSLGFQTYLLEKTMWLQVLGPLQ